MFELTLSKEQMLAPLMTVAGAVDKKQSLPILSHILLKLAPNTLVLTATDLEIEMTARLSCIHEEAPADITIPAKKIIDIVRSLEDGDVFSIHCKDSGVTVKSGRSQFKLATLPAAHFPDFGDEQADLELTVPRLQLIHLLQSTQFAMSQQDVRVFLNGLLLEIDNQNITAVATDGHRMAICRMPYNSNTELQRFLVPKKGIQELLRLLNSIDDEQVVIAAGKGHFKLLTRAYSFSSKLIEARFPPYIKAIPKQQDKTILVFRDSLKRALSRIMILANEKSRAVLLHMQAGLFTLVANNQDQEEASETLETETSGEEIKIGFNASYLLDVLSILPEGMVRISMSTTDQSLLVESVHDESYQYIIMPMKL